MNDDNDLREKLRAAPVLAKILGVTMFKPRARYLRGRWWCSLGHSVGTGDTIDAALRDLYEKQYRRSHGWY